MSSLFERAAERPTADQVALDDDVRQRTWAELLDRANRLAHVLEDTFGVREGGHVAMIMGNRVEYAELAVAAFLAGVRIAPVNWHYTAAEVEYLVQDSSAKVLFADPAYAETAKAAAGDVPVVVAGDELDGLVAAARDEPLRQDHVAGGMMLYTSGTTGRPKGVLRPVSATVEQSMGGLVAYAHSLGLDAVGTHLVTGPLYHGSPWGFAQMDLLQGNPVAIMPRFDAADMLTQIQHRRVVHTHCVPVMFHRALQLPEEVRDAFDPSSLHVVLHGAAPISVAAKRRMIEWWGPVLTEYWGTSEAGGFTSVTSADWLQHPGTVGHGHSFTYDIVAMSPELEELPPGEVGVLYAKARSGDAGFSYHNDPGKTAEAIPKPGLLTMGDMGYVDADGWVFLSDRASDMIISGGVNIYPAEIEAVLVEHPAVRDVAVFGVPDAEWGESVKAVVELREGFTASPELGAEIQAWARERMAGYKVPRSVDFEDALPRQENGKLYKRVLKDRYWPTEGRRI